MSAKVALITGATSGIGRAAAVAFARLGYSLSLSGRSADRLASVSTECREANGACDVVATRADLCSESDVQSLFEATQSKFGRLDALVNNAGVIEFGSIETTSLEQFDRVMGINIRSVYQLTHLCVPLLKESRGCIVNVSSLLGVRSSTNVLAYSVSKAAMDQFTRCVALELAAHGVRCNSVNPGVVVTNLQRSGGLSEQQYAEFLERSKGLHPLGRCGQPEDVVDAILFLADSERSSFVTGVTLSVDGGRHAACPR